MWVFLQIVVFFTIVFLFVFTFLKPSFVNGLETPFFGELVLYK